MLKQRIAFQFISIIQMVLATTFLYRERDRNTELLIEVLGFATNERIFEALLNLFQWKIGIMHGVLK